MTHKLAKRRQGTCEILAGPRKASRRTTGAPMFKSGIRSMLIVLAAATRITHADEPPVLESFPSRTGIADLPFETHPPEVLIGDSPIFWSVFEAPPGMAINPLSGELTWPQPREGYHRFSIAATNLSGADYVEWVLRVVANDFPDPRMYSTKYVDFIAPAPYVEWMETWNVRKYVDGYWERLRDLLGQEPLDGKQIYKYAPGGGGGAHSGNPAEAGPGWWTTDPVQGWSLAIWHHEVGHNFHGRTRIGRITGDNWADAFFHHGMELSQASVLARVVENPQAFGLSGEALANFLRWAQSLEVETVNRARPYLDWLANGGRAKDYTGDAYGAWARICRILQSTYGPSVLENTLRAVRVDGLPEYIYNLTDTPLKKNSLLFCILSAAANTDLRDFFDDWGFDTDDTYYAQVFSQVSNTVANLVTGEDANGWKRSPVNGHYYRFTEWPMTWFEAERTARRAEGHLATIRSQAEESWLTSRFGVENNFWMGFNDVGIEGLWLWSSGAPVTYENWGGTEPNGGSWENAAIFFSSWVNWQWVDVSTSSRFWGIIESPVAPRMLGDIDGDGYVTLLDAAQLIECLAGPEFPLAPACGTSDLNGDGDVDLGDFARLQRVFGYR